MLQGALSVECFEKQPEQLKAKTLQSHTHNSRANSLFSVNSVNCKEAMQNVTKSVANIHQCSGLYYTFLLYTLCRIMFVIVTGLITLKLEN